jgi:hypothetical protein
MRVLVCGGRYFAWHPPGSPGSDPILAERDRLLLRRTLDELRDDLGIECVIHSDLTGVGRAARDWARRHSIADAAYPANLTRYGPAAGSMRNTAMLAEGKPKLVIAFKGGKGTADMVAKAEAIGIKVRKVGW